ncbi:hypothetical protein F383_33500 [Gossypium arboreum]|uniref:Uncharacterized protein n=1 Tax=Gossypium arboreum TaxID=29729 RepID=A0A0B0MX36_GOSAR|nr:hypothetical protein F383_33500 [Gossypium arboreum]
MMKTSVAKLARNQRSSEIQITLSNFHFGMLRIEHTGRDTGVCLNRVNNIATGTGVCPGSVKSAPIL